jgi:hypothetical protein
VWINDFAKVYDEFEEGGFKPSGLGRMNGLAVLDDFVEYKHITINTGVIPRGCGCHSERSEESLVIFRSILKTEMFRHGQYDSAICKVS